MIKSYNPLRAASDLEVQITPGLQLCPSCEGTGRSSTHVNCPKCLGVRQVLIAKKPVARKKLAQERRETLKRYDAYFKEHPAKFAFQPEDFLRAQQVAQAKFGDPLGAGRHRQTYRDGDFVVKIPLSNSGIYANNEEVHHTDVLYAWSSLDELSWDLFPMLVLRMEFVHHTGAAVVPNWTWSVDCGQLGWTMDGRLRAYDWERTL